MDFTRSSSLLDFALDTKKLRESTGRVRSLRRPVLCDLGHARRSGAITGLIVALPPDIRTTRHHLTPSGTSPVEAPPVRPFTVPTSPRI